MSVRLGLSLCLIFAVAAAVATWLPEPRPLVEREAEVYLPVVVRG